MEMIDNKGGIQNAVKDSNDAPPPEKINIKFLSDFLSCPECFSLIEIESLDEENQILEFKCSKKNHENKKIALNKYLEIIQKNKKININEFKNQCEIHKNNDYISYCFDCKNHLCTDCLKKGTHINHKKNYIIEIKPVDKELKIIEEVINDYKYELNKIYKEK